MYGWKKAGTLYPPDSEAYLQEKDIAWDGNYVTNNGQVVTAEDGLNLALALEKALVDIPDPLPEPPGAEQPSTPGDSMWGNRRQLSQAPPGVDPEEYNNIGLNRLRAIAEGLKRKQISPADALGVDPQYKAYIQEFIVFCRQGAFRIY